MDSEKYNDANVFFELLEKYLIKDLIMMVEEIPPHKDGGGLGYPAIHSIIAGMELLGLIMSGKKGDGAFHEFWNNYLEERFPEYRKTELEKIFRGVIRDGTAHIFLVKSGVSVSKSNYNHLEIIDGLLNVDLKILLNHFLECYKDFKNDVLTNKIKLNDFNVGYKKLLTQMEYAKNDVQKFIKKNYTSAQISIQTISGSIGPTATILEIPKTDPPDYWLKNN